ncbi:tRNA threonylcarbamoyladenosine biosynthesis protein TsaB [Paenibacillus glucanolyticus]|uniref:tRNA threonylcarbamoyladenosine biosynthesis protein TsaB n=1 Tax=Paenibacillus glucanolyticus TaxID=59843 RepID=A0A163GY96_9BACL|nr:tRNA (adenosine(37)-N6)-threonylcarbamoyltransferase complex dimerization subunit type 1 TsaB [Paenibacillus glucanolyticus]KZS45213.1 tRNA threonylcarbamoyladenosine biosynthesis protein TsaB [Paenibacillus glucanolyticus]
MNNNDTKPQQRFLALDTSTASLAVSVMEKDKLLSEVNTNADRNHSVHLHSVMAQALAEAGVGMDQIEGIAVGIGPGSYTGIRIAVTAAKTLAWANHISVVGISSLHALAWGGLESGWDSASAEKGTHWVIPLLDARRGQVYTALFAASVERQEEAPVRIEADGIRLMQTWVNTIAERISRLPEEERPVCIWFVGEVDLHAETARQLEPGFENRVHIHPYSLEGRWMGYLGAARLLSGEADDLHTLIPNYTQLSEAEANLLRKR